MCKDRPRRCPCMGVKGLWKLLYPFGKSANLRDKRLAVDTSIWMCQLGGIPDNILPYAISKRILKLLFNGITPIFVFDGEAPQLKRDTRRMRRARRGKAGVWKQECAVCGKDASKCEHKGLLTQQKIEEMDAKTFERIRAHEYNWGEFSGSSTEESSTSQEEGSDADSAAPVSIIGSRRTQQRGGRPVNPIADLKAGHLAGLSSEQKLDRLIELRGMRGLPMPLDLSSPEALSLSQIRNVGKRNMVRELIDEVNDTEVKRVQSDWRYHIRYVKEERRDSSDDSDSGHSGASESTTVDSDATDVPALCSDSTSKGAAASREELERMYGHLASAHTAIPQLDSSAFYQTSKWEGNAMARRRETAGSAATNAAEQSFAPADDASHRYGLLDYSKCGRIDSANREGPNSDAPTAGSQDGAAYGILEKASGNVDIVKSTIIDVLKIFKICYIDSPEEADAQCASLFDQQVVDGVITEDNDLIVHGASVFKNFFKRNKPVMEYDAQEVLEGLSLSKRDLVKASFILGSDYAPGVAGIGIKKVLANLAIVDDADIAALEQIFEHAHTHKIDAFENGAVDLALLKAYFKNRGVSKDHTDEVYHYALKMQN